MKSLNFTHIALFLSLFFHLIVLTTGRAITAASYEPMERYNIRLLMSGNNIPSVQIKKSVIANKGQKKISSLIAENKQLQPITSENLPVANQPVIKETIVSNEAKSDMQAGETVAPSLATEPVEKEPVGNVRQGRETEKTGVEYRKAKKLTEYMAVIKAMIENNKEYPAFARQLGLQGTVVVRVSISPDGRIKDMQIITTSGHKSLDRSALGAVRTSGPFKSPVDYGLSDVTVDIPITFKLNERG